MTVLPAAGYFTDPARTNAKAAARTNMGLGTAAVLGATGRTDSTVAPTLPVDTKTDTYAVIAGDIGKEIRFNVATAKNADLTAAATLGNGFVVLIRSIGAGVVTIDPAAAELIDGVATVALAQDEWRWIVCDGTAWRTIAKSAASAAVLTKTYDSGEQTLTAAGALTLAHGMAIVPKLITSILVCKTAELNYSVGDEVVVDSLNSESSTNRGWTYIIDATNINVRFGSASNIIQLLDKTAGTGTGITPANWKLIVRAYA